MDNTKITESWTLKDKREYAWEYFKLHAGQRMALFNFFVVISALLTAGYSTTLKKDYNCTILGLFLSIGMILISFVFWKLDQRVAYLIKHAEAALKDIEKSSFKNEDTNALFCAEEAKTKEVKEIKYWKPWCWHMTYSKCFGVAYGVFTVIGLTGIIIAIIR